jgi:hypothetical protein
MARLHEQPDIEATRIVWEHALEGTARELLNAAEGETAKVSKFDEAKQFLADVLASAMRPATEIETLARAAKVSWASVRRASDEMGIRLGEGVAFLRPREAGIRQLLGALPARVSGRDFPMWHAFSWCAPSQGRQPPHGSV